MLHKNAGTFYVQLIETYGMTNTQLGWQGTINSAFNLIIGVPGAYLAGKKMNLEGLDVTAE